jgi:hypothetical protein
MEGDFLANAKLTAAQMMVLKDMFGPPPVLSSENIEHYNGLRDRMFSALRPQDTIELFFATMVVNDAWKIIRLYRHQALALERKVCESRKIQTQRKKQISDRKAADAKQRDENAEFGPEMAKLIDLDDKIDSLVPDVDEIFERIPTELEHNEAFERGIIFQERLDKLANSASRRMDKAMRNLERYRAVLAPYWRNAACDVFRQFMGYTNYTVLELPAILSTPMSENFGFGRPPHDNSATAEQQRKARERRESEVPWGQPPQLNNAAPGFQEAGVDDTDIDKSDEAMLAAGEAAGERVVEPEARLADGQSQRQASLSNGSDSALPDHQKPFERNAPGCSSANVTPDAPASGENESFRGHPPTAGGQTNHRNGASPAA